MGGNMKFLPSVYNIQIRMVAGFTEMIEREEKLWLRRLDLSRRRPARLEPGAFCKLREASASDRAEKKLPHIDSFLIPVNSVGDPFNLLSSIIYASSNRTEGCSDDFGRGASMDVEHLPYNTCFASLQAKHETLIIAI
jgi:hypothetical protein